MDNDRFEESVENKNISNMTILTEKSESVRVFPYTSPRRQGNRRSVYKVKVLQNNLRGNIVLHCCSRFQTNTLKFCSISPSSFF